LESGAAGRRLLVGAGREVAAPGTGLKVLRRKVNFTMMFEESQKPSPRSCSVLKERLGPTEGQACVGN
jgi:hypothetical protein